jgi:predicted ATPase with chaperone activity
VTSRGQESAKRALEIAAAGGHNLLMNRPRGAGKSMLAARLPSILPPLTPRELLEVSLIHSVAGQLAGGPLTDRRPFRAPHHSASMAALVGGGTHARPGEISLAAGDGRLGRSRGAHCRGAAYPGGRYVELSLPNVGSNAAAPGHLIEEVARPDPAGVALLREASERLSLSARGFHDVLKLARTIADLDGAHTVSRLHLAEALSYRIDATRQLRAA